MQVTCYTIDWNEVLKRSTAQEIVDELICSDYVSHLYNLPVGVWNSDSAFQHFEAAEEISKLIKESSGREEHTLSDVFQLISSGNALDELGICPLTDDCYFVSISPETAERLRISFNEVLKRRIPSLSEDSKDWIEQWAGALDCAAKTQRGLIAKCA